MEIVFVCEKYDASLTVAKFISLFRICNRQSYKRNDYLFLQYIKKINFMYIVGKGLMCVCLEWSGDGQVNPFLIQVTSSLEQRDLSVAKRARTAHLQNIQGL